MQLLVPAYFYPAGDGLAHWNRLISSADRAPITVIVNPASGPGERVDPNYTDVTGRARKAGLKLVGYVSTSYARVPIETAKRDVDRWLTLYPDVQGFFLDEQHSGQEQVTYYAELCRHIRKRLPKAIVIGNPGTTCSAEYLAEGVLDAACLYERNGGFDTAAWPDWATKLSPERQAAIVYQIESNQALADHLRAAEKRGIGWVYFTDAVGANPYDRLPNYWEAEVDGVADVSAGP